MSQVNLLPPEILERQKWRRLTLMVVAGGAVVIGLVFVFYLLQAGTLGGVRDDIDAQRATNEGLRGEIAELQRFEDLQVLAQAKQQLITSAFAGEVSLSGMLMDVSRVIPSDAALNSLAIAITPVSPDAVPVEGAPTFVGTITTSGEGDGIDTLSTWLTRLEQVEGWVNPWMSSISRRGEGETVFTFSSGVDLTVEVVTERGGRVVSPDEG